MKQFFLSTLLPLTVMAFHTPYDKSIALPYGTQIRAVFSARIPKVEETLMRDDNDLDWWHSLSRNNTINCSCGKYQVVNATDRWADEGIKSLNVYSWSVSLVAPGQHYAFCGGTLVNDRYVLTAASCVDGAISSGVEVLIGTWPMAHLKFNDTEKDPDELNLEGKSGQSMIRKKVHRVILHPNYSSDHLDHNIALLRLKGPVPTFGNERGVTHVCLPSEIDNFEGAASSSLLWRFFSDEETIIPVKRTEVMSQIISKQDCIAYNHTEEWTEMPDTMMCARTIKPAEITPYSHSYDCPGDSGGPLLVTAGNQKVQVGIDSWTACYGRPRGIGVYTRLSEFLPWINRHISKDGRHCAY